MPVLCRPYLVFQADSRLDSWTIHPQSIFPLVAPALFAASIYMILGRIILVVDGQKYSLVKKTWLTTIFVASDILSFLAVSGGM
jgi:hypothetical protein